MLSQKVKEYISEHSLSSSECLFKDWEFFLDLLYAEGGRITAILWWDYCKIAEQHLSIGSGGYRDLDNTEYMYAETQSIEDGLETKTLEEIKKYITKVRKTGIQYINKYISHDLVPSFYLFDEIEI